MKRAVFYLPGFDPRGSAYYYRVFKEQAQRQSAVVGMDFTLTERKKRSTYEYAWQWASRKADQKAHIDYHYLAWDDLVRQVWLRSVFRFPVAILILVRAYVFTGAFRRMGHLAKSSLIAGLFPALFVAFCLLASVAVGFAIHAALAYWLGWLALVVALPGGLWVYQMLARLGERINVFWLLRIYLFTYQWGCRGNQALEQRLDWFAERIIRAVQSDEYDEVLIVGHSVGAILTVPLVARLVGQTGMAQRIKLLTLGHCIPMISELACAKSYHQALIEVAKADPVWFDVTAAMDGAAFYGTSPLYWPQQQKGIRPQHLHCFSARFHTLFCAATYRSIRKDWYRMHFQYLMATEKPGLMDFFNLTCGPESIADVFARYPQGRLKFYSCGTIRP